MKKQDTFSERVHTIVARIPRGRVATYGQVASMAGSPRSARMVGWVLAHSVHSLPWQRVINKEGRLSIVNMQVTAKTQATLLAREEVVIIEHDNAYWVDLKRYLWHPREHTEKRKRTRV